MKTDYRCKYELCFNFGIKKHIWSVVNAAGGIHLHISQHGESVYGGLELHSRTPLYGSDRAPTGENCWLIGGPCWHDGSSLAAEEYWIPLWKSGADHEAILGQLCNEIQKYQKGLTDED